MCEKDYYKKIKGSLIGGFLADSIGFLFEGASQKQISPYLKIIQNKDIKNYNRGNNGPERQTVKSYFKFGQYTDDSQLTVAAMETIVKNNGRFSFVEYGKEISKLFNEKTIVGYGSSTKKFVENFNRGVEYRFSGAIGTTSNGSLMRSDIFGLMFFNNFKNLKECVLTQSMMTHQSSVCAACAYASSYIVYYLMNNNNFESDELLYELYEQIKTINMDVATAILELKYIINMDFDMAYKNIKKYQTIKWGDGKLSSCAITTLMWALYSFLKNKYNYMDCILNCYRVGGDVDTIAKIAGSYSGCFLGIDNVPKELLYHIHDRTKNYDKVRLNIEKLTNLIKENKINIVK